MKTNSIFRWFSGIALLLGLMTQGVAQTENMGVGEQEDNSDPVYQSFFDGNPVYTQMWNVYEYKWDGGMTIKSHGLEDDTMVDGVLYHKMSVLGKNWENGWREQFLVRENETHDKVWVRLPWDSKGQERLVVDMNLKPGDLFPVRIKPDTVYYEVDTVYYMEHVGGNLKHIRLKPTTDSSWTQALADTKFLLSMMGCDWQSINLEFVEGVGSNLGFVYYRLGLSGYYEDSLWEQLRLHDYRVPSHFRNKLAPYDYIVCMEKDGEVYYEHPNPECAACTDEIIILDDELIYDEFPPIPGSGSANERVQSMSRYLLVSPNPAAETATLQWDASADSRVSMASCNVTLYDMQGVRLRSFTTDRWPYTLSVSDLASGAYLLRVVPVEAPAEGAWKATVRLMVR